MSPFIFRLPDIGEGVAEAEITIWHVKPGDRIAEDQSLVDVMTDKATVDMTSPVEGTVLAIHGSIGDMVPVGAPLVEIQPTTEELSSPLPLGERSTPLGRVRGPSPDIEQEQGPLTRPEPALVREATRGADLPQKRGEEAPRAVAPPEPPPPRGAVHANPLAAPATRRRAFELGIPLQFVTGTGSAGRIVPEDLDRYLASGSVGSAAPTPSTSVTEIKLTGLRRKIAERMQESKRRIPHFTYVEEFDMTALESLRTQLNAERKETQPKLTLLPFFMRAVVQLRVEFPEINARYDDDAGILWVHEASHIGIATQTPGGLMVPVVRHAETLNLWDCARELVRVTTAARDGSATRDELTGSTITLTSLGALGGIAATPIINAPEVAIIGPNKLVERPTVIDGQIVIRKLMNLSSSFDHRIIDGHDAARFVQRLKRLIETPALIFLEAP